MNVSRLATLLLLALGLAAVYTWMRPSPPAKQEVIDATVFRQERRPLRSRTGTANFALPPEPESSAIASEYALELNAAAVALAERGDYERAAVKLRMALIDSPGVDLLQRNLQAVLLSWAERSRSDDDTLTAIDLLGEASTLGDRFEVWHMLGSLHLDRLEFEEARAPLRRAFDHHPERADIALGLANALTEFDQRAEALDILLRARESGARHAQIDILVGRLSREVDAEWDFVRVETPHFDLDFDEEVSDQVVASITDALERAYDDVGTMLGSFPDRPVRAVLYAREDFHSLTNTPDWTQGVFDGRIKIPLRGLQADDPTVQPVLRHEYAHHIVHELSNGRCPTWLNEGIAMWAEGQEEARVAWAERRIKRHRLITLANLQGSFARLPARQAERAYAQSYMTVLHILDRFGDRALVRLLKSLGSGNTLTRAFRSEFRLPLDTFESEVARNLGSRG